MPDNEDVAFGFFETVSELSTSKSHHYTNHMPPGNFLSLQVHNTTRLDTLTPPPSFTEPTFPEEDTFFNEILGQGSEAVSTLRTFVSIEVSNY